MKTLALIHTSPVLTPMFGGLAKELLGDTRVFHMVDESLIANTIRSGSLQKDTIRRVVNHVDSAARAGADVVLVTCSSIGPAVNVARQLFDFPVLRIDEAMAEHAVDTGNRIGVIATLNTTLAPTVKLLHDTAEWMNGPVEVVEHLCEGAFQAVISGDTATHDRAVTAGLKRLAAEDVEVIVLAQASMARVVDQLPPGELRVPVLSSPRLAMERARDVLAG